MIMPRLGRLPARCAQACIITLKVSKRLQKLNFNKLHMFLSAYQNNLVSGGEDMKMALNKTTTTMELSMEAFISEFCSQECGCECAWNTPAKEAQDASRTMVNGT